MEVRKSLSRCWPEFTNHIRIGIAGVLLRLYSPYKVAQNFRLLHTMFPGRIDLGIARGFVPPPWEEALVGNQPQAPFTEKVASLLAYLRGHGQPIPSPALTPVPEIWMLGSAATSMKLAAEYGAAFSFALFLGLPDASPVAEVLAQYRGTFKPSEELKQPKWSIALAGICAERLEEAQAMLSRVSLGVTANLVGTPAMWHEKLSQLHEETGTTEFVILDLSRGLENRAQSYQLILSAVRGLHQK